jgi:hypothetical protein
MVRRAARSGGDGSFVIEGLRTRPVRTRADLREPGTGAVVSAFTRTFRRIRLEPDATDTAAAAVAAGQRCAPRRFIGTRGFARDVHWT